MTIEGSVSLFPEWILRLFIIPQHWQWMSWDCCLIFTLCSCWANTCWLHFLHSQPLASPLHFQYSTAATLVKVTDEFSIAKANGHGSANLTEPISSFLISSWLLPPSWKPFFMCPLAHQPLGSPPPHQLLLLELLCHPLNVRGSVPRSLLISMYTHSLCDLIQPSGPRYHLHVDNSKI